MRRTRARVDVCICGKPVALHFDARARKLDCAQVTDKQTALARARADVERLARYIKRLEQLR